jgi:glutamate racemase
MAHIADSLLNSLSHRGQSATLDLSRQYDSFANQPIGVFDSGMGGLSVVQEIQAYLPHERIMYLADTKHVPYGSRSDEEIRDLTAQAVDWLYLQGCKAVVVACNTASAFSLTHLREKYGDNFPVIGLVPAVKPAVLKSQTRVVGVLATPGTLRGTLLKEVIAQVAVPHGVQVLTAVSPALVPFVEHGEQYSQACQDELLRVLEPLKQAGADYLVLGCTHYPFLKPSIQAVFGQQFGLIDSGLAVARQTGRVLAAKNLVRTEKSTDNLLQCYVTGCAALAQPVFNALMHYLPEQAINIQLADIR